MYISTPGIVIRQTKTLNARRMLVVFSEELGKISLGTSISEKGRGKSALAIRPFTLGNYGIYRNRERFNLSSAETVKSFYGIGADADRYMNAAYALEFTDKLLPEEEPAKDIFKLLLEFLTLMEVRASAYETLTLGYIFKLLDMSGSAPRLRECLSCGSKENMRSLSVAEGGVLCSKCCERRRETIGVEDEKSDIDRGKLNMSDRKLPLIFDSAIGIIEVLRYFSENPLKNLESLALNEDAGLEAGRFIREYAAYHIGIGGLKSEKFLFEKV